jgi:NAD(P)-dependent dehydrogenase (short-subunit alcohol dehydrogenase family)
MNVANGGNASGALKGKVALVTGAARGIGRAIALELANRGAMVAINYRASEAHAESLALQIRDLGSDCKLIQGDVACKEEARRVVRTVLEHWNQLDILVNNAGVIRDKSQRKMADDEWADVINVNLNGTYFCTTAALPSMMERKYGRIINISSYLEQSGNAAQANSTGGKGGIIAFTKALALDMAKFNITANAIAPGFTSTETLADVPPNILEQIRKRIPLQRFADPREVAQAAAFLACEGDYITGQQLNVNGGLYL